MMKKRLNLLQKQANLMETKESEVVNYANARTL